MLDELCNLFRFARAISFASNEISFVITVECNQADGNFIRYHSVKAESLSLTFTKLRHK